MSRDLLAAETAFYDRHRVEFETGHLLEWVVIHGEEVVGFYEDFQVAAQTAVERFGRGPYLIRQIGQPPRTLPISVLCHPVYADD